jgi:hypothetical protein
MNMTLQPVLVETGGPDEEGCLVFVEGKLVALLVRLSDQHEDEGIAGHWFFEAGFGPLDGPAHPSFSDIEAAQGWIAERLQARPS